MRLSLKRFRFWNTDPIVVSHSLVPETSAELHPPLVKRGYAEIKDPQLRAIVMSFDPYLGKGAHQIGDVVRTRNNRLAQVIEYDGKQRLIWISPSNEELTRGKQKALQDNLLFAAELADHQRLLKMPWPALGETNFQQKVQTIFAQLGLVPEAVMKIDPQACSKTADINLRYYQKIVSSFLVYGPSYRGLLVIHGLGSGKTASSIGVIDKFIRYADLQTQTKGPQILGDKSNRPKVFVVLPPKKSLDENFRTELANAPSSVRDQIRQARERGGKIDMANRIINRNITIISYISLANRLRAGKMDLENSLMILDEAHNFLQPAKQFQKGYAYLQDRIKKTKQCKIVMLTATPIFRSVTDMPRLMNILKKEGDPKFPEDEVTMLKTFYKDGVLNQKAFIDHISGHVSFYDISNDPSYFAKLVYLQPSVSAVSPAHYARWLESKKSEFKTYGITDETIHQLPLLTNSKFKDPVSGLFRRSSVVDNFPLAEKKAGKYTPKFFSLYHDISNTPRRPGEKFFVYSKFKEKGSSDIGRFLESMGWVRMSNNKRDHGDHPPQTPVNPLGKELIALGNQLKRREIDRAQYTARQKSLIAENLKKPYMGFVVCNSATSQREIEASRSLFNSEENADGRLVRVFIGDETFGEGVSFFNVMNVSIFEPPSSLLLMDQIIARARRYCSHKAVPFDQRVVRVKLYFHEMDEARVMTDHLLKYYSEDLQRLLQPQIDSMVQSSIEYGLQDRAKLVKVDKQVKPTFWARIMQYFQKSHE